MLIIIFTGGKFQTVPFSAVSSIQGHSICTILHENNSSDTNAIYTLGFANVVMFQVSIEHRTEQKVSVDVYKVHGH